MGAVGTVQCAAPVLDHPGDIAGTGEVGVFVWWRRGSVGFCRYYSDDVRRPRHKDRLQGERVDNLDKCSRDTIYCSLSSKKIQIERVQLISRGRTATEDDPA
jgi:hypothetical protein